MNRVAFLSTDNLEGFVFDDVLAHGPLASLGWEVETVSWRNPTVDWSTFAGVVIRTTWDYHNHLKEFLKVLDNIEARTRLANSLSIVRWNSTKTYLRDLELKGALVVPTIWEHDFCPQRIESWFKELKTNNVVIKPTVSASAENTFSVHKESDVNHQALSIFAGRQYMVQPFMKGIVEEGEYSLFYFNGNYSHTILKTPKAKDFRVQEEHGGLIQSTQPAAALLKTGERVMSLITPVPLYARVDFVREKGVFVLMELELIEPSLYLRMEEAAPQRFAEAINKWLS